MKNTLLALISIVALIALLPTQAHAAQYIVLVTDTGFVPDTLPTARVGDTIHWRWASGNNTTTSTAVPGGAAAWDAPINSHDSVFNYVVTVGGNYSYRSTLDTSFKGFFPVVDLSGIGNKSLVNVNLKIFPNPIKADMAVTFHSSIKGQGNIRIYDLTGKEVSHHPAEISVGDNNVTIPLGDLQSGMYMAEVMVGTQQIGVRRVIKE